MRKRIQRQILKMMIVFLGTLGLVSWQFEFIWTGITSNIYLNSIIISLFFFGITLAFSSAFRLKNEELAFVALQESYDDIKFEEERSKNAPYWRHYRCLEPGIVFTKPRLLGHVFDLTYEKMMRTRQITISIGTMQSLVSEFKTKIVEDRAMLQYVTGILVFLGLIGTFIGLMDMVGSVGGIIGSIANMDMSDPTAAFTKLIQDLQAPLVGMATGFSSSLFGLFGSLILGLLGRFLAEATGILRGGLESWLSSMADLDGDRDEAEHREAVLDLLEAQHEQLAAMHHSMQQLAQVAAHGAHAQREALSVLQGMAGPEGVKRLTAKKDGEQASEEGLEQAVSAGFSDMSRAMESAFIGYAQLLHRSMAMHDKSASSPEVGAREGTNG
ncbi:MAG: hypothetical protein JJ908_15270 [Rhizobiales bacterium]|nr:hypothetical protein [Hyphomicrobiales bacterium]MBO6700106.1 hypothetical protein [Hyphomicrobiales bacterium]MBO6737729.1 hypothetical protein [Hyphomicrobiales bacterium]MBO6913214.1 hypothetical protein [Hyphomicrobiales bacterium]MBO6954258.1 hypothetical protein [Hyphomicrobiales bacterium]